MEGSMKKDWFKRTVSVLVSGMTLTLQCIPPESVRAAFWEERRKYVHRSRQTPTKDLTSLALPSPRVDHFFPNKENPISVDLSALGETAGPDAHAMTSDSSRFLRLVRPSFGTVRKIVIPKNGDALLPTKGKTVFLIEDVHANFEAQTNIGKILIGMFGSHGPQSGVGVVALEGAAGPLDLSRFRSFHDKDALRAAADYLLEKGRISGPAHAGLTHLGNIPPVVGVDDLFHYRANVKAYQTSAPKMIDYKRHLSELETALRRSKQTAFNQMLKDFDEQSESYHSGALSLGNYVKKIASFKQGLAGPSTEKFLQALEVESHLDLSKVEAERKELLEQLARTHDQKYLSAIADLSVKYRAGQMSHGDFYRTLEALCRQGGVNLARFPEMDAYIRYVLLAEAIDAEGLLADIQTMETAVYAQLAITPIEKKWVAQSKQLSLIKKLLDFSLTNGEWEDYLRLNASSCPLWAQFGNDGTLKSFESFYREAQARDQSIAKNVLKAMSDTKSDIAVLVAGGFHSAGITERLGRSGITVAQIVPKITHVDTDAGSSYLGVFTQEKTPLDKLFQGKKLFVSDHPLAGAPELPGLMVGYANRNEDVPTPKDIFDFHSLLPKETAQVVDGWAEPAAGNRVNVYESRDGQMVETEIQLDSQGQRILADQQRTTQFWKSASWVLGIAGAVWFGVEMGDMIPVYPLLAVVIVVFSGVAHELAHGWMAKHLGDHTAEEAGRLTLSPWRHLDLWGTLSMGVSTALAGVPVGWMKAVPIGSLSREDRSKVALAGPVVSAVLAVAVGAGWVAAEWVGGPVLLTDLLVLAFKINLAMALLNLVPLRPLDGSHVFPDFVQEWLTKKLGVMPLAGSAVLAGVPVLGGWCEEEPLKQYLEDHFKDADPETKQKFVELFQKELEEHFGLPFQIITRSKFNSADFYIKKMEQAAKKLTATLHEVGVGIEKEVEKGNDEGTVNSLVTAHDAEHAAAHAVPEAINELMKSGEYTPEAFARAIRGRIVRNLRGVGRMNADGDAVLAQIVDQTRLENGQTVIEAIQSWQEEYHLLAALALMAEQRKKTGVTLSSGKTISKKEGDSNVRGYFHSHSGKKMVSFLVVLGASLLSAYTGFPTLFLTTETSPTIEPVEEYLKTFSALTGVEQDLLLRLTYDPGAVGEGQMPIIGRSQESQKILSSLDKPFPTKNSVLLLAPKGVGKTAMVNYLARKMARGELGPDFAGKRVLALRDGVLSDQEKSKTLSVLVSILKKTDGRIILFVDEIHAVTVNPFTNQPDPSAADLLKNPLEKGEVTLIGCTTPEEFKRYMEPITAYTDRFSIVKLEEPDFHATQGILRDLKKPMESKFGVHIGRKAIDAVIRLTSLYQAVIRKNQPRSAIDTLTEAISRVKTKRNGLNLQVEDLLAQLRVAVNLFIELKKEGEPVDSREMVETHNRIVGTLQSIQDVQNRLALLSTELTITESDIKTYLSESSGISVKEADAAEAEKLLGMEAIIGRRVVGQLSAIERISDAVRTNKAGLTRKGPIGSFILVGPTGVGKTELAKALAEFLFEDEKSMVRINMEEFQQAHTVSKLIGAPHGYVGYGEKSQLIDPVRENPYRVLLVDEFEKAHPDVMKIFLSILDDGVLNDANGNVIDFSNTILVFTSNAGMSDIQDHVKRLADGMGVENQTATVAQMNDVAEQAARTALREKYPPEFMNRFDGIIPCGFLTPVEVRQIARILVHSELKSLEEKEIALTIDEDVFEALADRGYDVLMGARPLRRLIQTQIVQPIGRFILAEQAQGRSQMGGTIHLSLNGDAFSMRFDPNPMPMPKLAPSEEIQVTHQALMDAIDGIVNSSEDEVSPESLTNLLQAGRRVPDGTQMSGPYGSFWARTATNGSNVNPTLAFHNDPNKIDGAVTTFRNETVAAVGTAMASTAKTWLREFTRLAKQNNKNGRIGMSRVRTANGEWIVRINRPGSMTEAEELFLKNHATPELTTIEDVRAEALRLKETHLDENPNLDLLELKAEISGIPGARYGFEENGNDVVYWVQFPGVPSEEEMPMAQGVVLEGQPAASPPVAPLAPKISMDSPMTVSSLRQSKQDLIRSLAGRTLSVTENGNKVTVNFTYSGKVRTFAFARGTNTTIVFSPDGRAIEEIETTIATIDAAFAGIHKTSAKPFPSGVFPTSPIVGLEFSDEGYATIIVASEALDSFRSLHKGNLSGEGWAIIPENPVPGGGSPADSPQPAVALMSHERPADFETHMKPAMEEEFQKALAEGVDLIILLDQLHYDESMLPNLLRHYAAYCQSIGKPVVLDVFQAVVAMVQDDRFFPDWLKARTSLKGAQDYSQVLWDRLSGGPVLEDLLSSYGTLQGPSPLLAQWVAKINEDMRREDKKTRVRVVLESHVETPEVWWHQLRVLFLQNLISFPLVLAVRPNADINTMVEEVTASGETAVALTVQAIQERNDDLAKQAESLHTKDPHAKILTLVGMNHARLKSEEAVQALLREHHDELTPMGVLSLKYHDISGQIQLTESERKDIRFLPLYADLYQSYAAAHPNASTNEVIRMTKLHLLDLDDATKESLLLQFYQSLSSAARSGNPQAWATQSILKWDLKSFSAPAQTELTRKMIRAISALTGREFSNQGKAVFTAGWEFFLHWGFPYLVSYQIFTTIPLLFPPADLTVILMPVWGLLFFQSHRLKDDGLAQVTADLMLLYGVGFFLMGQGWILAGVLPVAMGQARHILHDLPRLILSPVLATTKPTVKTGNSPALESFKVPSDSVSKSPIAQVLNDIQPDLVRFDLGKMDHRLQWLDSARNKMVQDPHAAQTVANRMRRGPDSRENRRTALWDLFNFVTGGEKLSYSLADAFRHEKASLRVVVVNDKIERFVPDILLASRISGAASDICFVATSRDEEIEIEKILKGSSFARVVKGGYKAYHALGDGRGILDRGVLHDLMETERRRYPAATHIWSMVSPRSIAMDDAQLPSDSPLARANLIALEIILGALKGFFIESRAIRAVGEVLAAIDRSA